MATVTIDLDTVPFGRKLRALRLAAGLTQEDVAVAAGVSQETVSYWERLIDPPVRKDGRSASAKIERVLTTGAEAGAEK